MKLLSRLLFTLAVLSLAVCCGKSDDADLDRLDAALAESGSYVAAHERQVKAVESGLISDQPLPDSVRFEAYRKLYELNYSFQYEKTLSALQKQEEIAVAACREDWINEVRLHKAMLFSTAGLYENSKSMSEQVDTTMLTGELMKEFYEYEQHFCRDYYQYMLPERDDALLAKAAEYRQKLIRATSEDEFFHKEMVLMDLIDARNLDSADSIAIRLTESLPSDSHEYAIAAYWRGVVCFYRNDLLGERKWYTESAIADIMTGTKDCASLYSIALNLLNVGDDVERAFRYTQIALDDALFYNGKLRPLQIAQSLPAIEKAFVSQKESNERRLMVLVMIVSVLAIVMLAVISMIMSYHRRLRKAISELSEASAAKEEFLALFLSMSSGYLDKLKHFLTRSQMDDELKDFYSAFDNAFIQLYPTFVEEFNALLEPESRVELKGGELLNTQLRIFALIRLGIDQSSHIASLLRYSVNTIYNYRAQTKAAAISGKDDFELQVKAIGRK